ncbi:MAG: mobilization protein [Burkholderiaceae bacterium]|nr:mobilization protein [Burkholderiaceae bacterium]
MNSDPPPRKHKGGRRKGDPADVRNAVIGVRVSAAEYAELCQRSTTLHMKPAQWLRTAALTRRIPSPPVAAINREQYVELARLSANLNQLTRLRFASVSVMTSFTAPSLAQLSCFSGFAPFVTIDP